MKRAVIIAAALAVVAAGAWALWPEDDASVPGASPIAQGDTPSKPMRSLADQLDDFEGAFASADAGFGSVTGLVQDEQGNPVAGAEVKVHAPHGTHTLDSATCPVCEQPILDCDDVHTAREVFAAAKAGKGQPKLLATAYSQTDGTFHFESLPNEELELTAKKP